MPIYEYQCDNCGQFEVTQKITDKTLSRCPTCKAKVKKLISHTSFQLKGTGWYVTDYARKDNGGKKAKADPDAKGKSASETGDKKTSGEKTPPKAATSESPHP